MRRIAHLYRGRAKTDARDAFIIAGAACSMLHTLRPADVGDDAWPSWTCWSGSVMV